MQYKHQILRHVPLSNSAGCFCLAGNIWKIKRNCQEREDGDRCGTSGHCEVEQGQQAGQDEGQGKELSATKVNIYTGIYTVDIRNISHKSIYTVGIKTSSHQSQHLHEYLYYQPPKSSFTSVSMLSKVKVHIYAII